MPRPGYTIIIVKDLVRSRLQELAEDQDYRTINQLLEAWIEVHPGVNPTNINGEIGPPRSELEIGFFSKGNLKIWSLGRDLNPRPSPYQAKPPAGFCTSSNQTIDWKLFEKWLFKEYRKRTAKDRLKYARRYYRCLHGDLKPLMVLDGDKRLHAMKALSALSKFLGVYEEWRSLVRNYGLKWSSGKTDDLIIARFAKVQNSDEALGWIRKIKAAIPDFSGFMDLVAVTGLRLGETINCWNLIIRLSSEGRLEEYYKAENCVLEHFRFKELFIRRTKKAFISFIDQDLISRITESNPLTKNQITKRIQRRKINLRFGDVREFWASYMTRHLRQPEI